MSIHLQYIYNIPGNDISLRLQPLIGIYVTFIIVRCLNVFNVHFCKKSQKLAQMTFDRYLSNPDIGRTFWDGLTHSN